MKQGTKWTGFAVLAGILIAFGLGQARGQEKKSSSYAPVAIQEEFSAVMSRMKAARPEVMKRHNSLLEARYDLAEARSARQAQPLEVGEQRIGCTARARIHEHATIGVGQECVARPECARSGLVDISPVFAECAG